MPGDTPEREPRLPMTLPETAAPETLTRREAAAAAGINLYTVDKWVRKGYFQRIARGQIDAVSFRRYLQQRKQGQRPVAPGAAVLSQGASSATVTTEAGLPRLEAPVPSTTLTAAEAAEQLGVRVSQVHKLARQGRLQRFADMQFDAASVEHYRQQRDQGKRPGASSAQALGPIDRLRPAAAADAVGVPRSTFRDAITRRRVELDADGMVTIAELLRAGYTLKDPSLLPPAVPAPQAPPPVVSSMAPPGEPPTVVALEVALLRQEREALKQHNALLERELEDAKAIQARLLSLLEAVHVPPLRPPAASGSVSASASPAVRSGPLPVWQQVLEYVTTSPRPRRAWQVQRALGLSKPPHRELARLCTQKKIERVGPGLYAAPGTPVEASSNEDTPDGQGELQC